MSDKPRPMKGNSLGFSFLFSRNAKAKASSMVASNLSREPSGEASATEPGQLASSARESAASFYAEDADSIDLIVASQMFDVDWYRQQFQEGTCPESDLRTLILHYLTDGAAAGLNPHPLFDTRYYIDNNSDLRNVNPLLHFLQSGGNRGRNPHPRFDCSWYLRAYPDVAAAAINPLVHYITSGAVEGRNPSPDFDSLWYQRHYQKSEGNAVRKGKLPDHQLNALEHFVRFGMASHYATNKEDYRRLLENDFALVDAKRVFEEAALPVFTSGPYVNRINLIVDRVPSNSNHPVATCLALGSQLALAADTVLRVVTRKERAQESSWLKIMAEYSLAMPKKVEFVFSDYIENAAELSFSARDVFIVAGWRNAVAVRASIEPQKICCMTYADPGPLGADSSHPGSFELDASDQPGQSTNCDFTMLAIPRINEFDSARADVISQLRRLCDRVFV